MKEFERVKIFSGADTDDVENAFNQWVLEYEQDREANPVLSNFPLNITHRDLTIRNYEGEETFALAIFYKHRHLEAWERGNVDKGAGGGGAVSMVGGPKPIRGRK